MRTHPQIISDLGGPLKVAGLVHADIGGDFEVVRKRVHAWNASGSIPGEYWTLLERSGAVSVAELAKAAERRKFPDRQSAPEAAA